MASDGGGVSSTRLYLGNLPPQATKADIEEHFKNNAPGKILEVKLMNGFGFLEFEDKLDARDVVPEFHGSDFMGSRLVVQFARGSRPKDGPYHQERLPPRTRRTVYRMSLSNLTAETSWQDLKDFARQDGLDVVYSEVSRERDGKGFVEYETLEDLDRAVNAMNNTDFKGQTVRCVKDVQPERPRDRMRSRSPPPARRGGYQGGYDDYYDRRPPPRGYTPRPYRDRSPPRRGYFDERGDRYGRPPPQMRGPPMDDYPPPRRPYPDDAYGPPRRGYGMRSPPPYGDDPYANGGHRNYGPPSPRRRTPPDYRRGYY